MTIAQLKAEVKKLHPRLSVKWQSEYSEYQVKVLGKNNATYFTSDRQDALDTARAMAKELQKDGE